MNRPVRSWLVVPRLQYSIKYDEKSIQTATAVQAMNSCLLLHQWMHAACTGVTRRALLLHKNYFLSVEVMFLRGFVVGLHLSLL